MFTVKYWRPSLRAASLATLLLAACSVTTNPNDSDGNAGGSGNDASGGRAGNAGAAARAGSSGVGTDEAGAAGASDSEAGAAGESDGDAGAAGRGESGGTSGSTSGGAGGKGGAGGTGGGAGGSTSGGSGGKSGAGGTGGGTVGGGGTGGGGTGGTGTGGTGGGSTGGPGPIIEEGHASTGPLVIQVTTAQTPAIPGQSLLYTITVGNTAATAVDGVNVLFRVPDGLSFVYTSDADPNSAACGNSVCSAGEEATWALGTLGAGTTQTIQVSASVLGTVGNGSNLASFFRLSATNVNPVTLTKNTDVGALPAAELTFGASADPVIAGQSVELTLDIGQIGDTPLSGGALKLYLPAGLQATTINDGGTADSSGAIVWPVASLDVGSTLRRTISATVAAGVVAGDILNPRATLEYAGGSAIDHVAQVPLSVVAAAPPLTLTVSPASTPIVPGGRILYHATVANRSLRAIDGVSLAFRVPRELSFVYTSDATPNSAACGNSVCSADEEAVWSLGTLAAGTSQTVEFNPEVVVANAGDGSLASGPFLVRATGVNPLNAFKTLPTHAKPAAQLALGTAVDPIVAGQSYSYDIDVGQIGTLGLAGTTLKLLLPSGVTVGTVSDGGTAAAGVVTWSVGAVPVAGNVHRTVQVTADATLKAGAVLGARALLTYDGGQELDALSEHALTVVSAPLPLTVVTTANISPIVLGGRVLYTTTIKNISERAIDAVTLSVRVPDGLSFVYTTDADPNSAACGNSVCSGAEEAVWALGTLAPGATRIVTFNPLADAAVTGGSLMPAPFRLTATDLGGLMQWQYTLPTKKN